MIGALKAFRFESLPALFGAMVVVLSIVIGISWRHLRDLYRKHRIDL